MKAEQEKTKDQEINEVGMDVQASKPTESEEPKPTENEESVKRVPKKVRDPIVVMKAAIKYLASNALGTPEYADFKQAFPDLFDEE